jgi:hypothetical protein
MKVLKSDENEALVLVGNTTLGSTEPDYCELTSRYGNITVGVSGEDHYVAEIGKWKKLGGYLKAIGRPLANAAE